MRNNEISECQSSDHPIVQSSRLWLGTPFKHQGRLKGVGVDCLGLLVGVAAQLKLEDEQGNQLAKYDQQNYGHLPDENHLTMMLFKCLKPCELKPAAIALFRIDGTARHLGIIGSYGEVLTLIHAYAPARKVVEHRLDEEWRSKLAGCFTLRNYNA